MESKASPPKESPAGSPVIERASKSPVQRMPSPTGGILPPENGPLEADDDEANGPWPEDDVASSTASLSSSVLKYRTIQGRTFHSNRGNAEYWGSNDEKQLEAMDLVHHAHTLLLSGRMFLAPLKDDIQKVVDIGTGTGIWAIDFADEYPNCEVIGTDISPTQPGWVPPNLKYEIEDCTQRWTFDPDSIDFVHLRYLTGSIQDWHALFREAYRCVRPGGWVESFDAGSGLESDDGTVTEGSPFARWGPLFEEGGKILGRTFRMLEGGLQRSGLEAAGFVDIQEADYKVPVGRWPKDPRMKDIGAFTSASLDQDVEGVVTYMANLIGWSKEEILVYAAQLRRDMRNRNIHGYYRVKVVWGRKPEA